MANVVQRVANLRVAPQLILSGKLNDEADDLIFGPRSAYCPFGAGIVFLSDKFSKPGSKCVGSCYTGDFLERTESDLLGLGCKPAPLAIIESQSFAMNFLQHLDFLLEIFDHGLLLSMDPTSQAQKNEFQGNHGGNMIDSA